MLPLLQNLAGKNVVVVGAGKTGAAAARLALRLGARVTIVDDADDAKVRTGLAKAGLDLAAPPDPNVGVARSAGAPPVTISAGGIALAVVDAADLIVLSPGVPRAHASIAPALARGVACVNEVELAAAHLPSTATIGITGTNGKSTTTTMCGAIAKSFDENAFVGGNLGTPYCTAALDVLDGKPAPKVAVLELSSYQLETLNHIAFDAAVVTNLSPDHLDRYPSAEAYYAAKARIFALVKPTGGASLNAADAESRTHLEAAAAGVHLRCDFDVSKGLEGISIAPAARAALPGTTTPSLAAEPSTSASPVPSPSLAAKPSTSASSVPSSSVPSLEVVWQGRSDVVTLANPRIVGHHNRQNAAAAVAAALLAGVPREAWQAGLDSYAGIAHRLEHVGEHQGVAWFNDSKGTNVDATMTAVKSFAGGVHLIAGGLGKGSSYQPLVDVSRGKVVAVYTIGKDAPAIEAAFAPSGIAVVPCLTLDVACAKAAAAAKPGEVILLSPACASFDQFKDYADRGNTFRNLFGSSH